MTLKEALSAAVTPGRNPLHHPELGDIGADLIWSDDLRDFALDRGDEICSIAGRFDLIPHNGWINSPNYETKPL